MSTSSVSPQQVSSQNKTAASKAVSNGGTTTVEDSVVAKVAGIATRDIPGVYALGGGAARALGALRDAVGQTDLTQGISVQVGQTQAAVDLSMIVEYPHPLQDVANKVREAITSQVGKIVGLEVVEVNITVTDVHVPNDDDENSETSAKKSHPAAGERSLESTSANGTEKKLA
ncbi:Asp23/Gls24 family envelope stress response protein [Pseudarthrobacter sp. J1738]|uniref:Asp23/Gls24 family envelope stress response protein n=1 Tax=unclassified Pseudarthrobacter TaxID=2647000 RepID=UPI003D2E8F71